MIFRNGTPFICLILLALSGCRATGQVQPQQTIATTDTLLVTEVPGVRFMDARAVAADPSGLLYVADAGSGEVRILSPAGVTLRTLGGEGSGRRFVEPYALDPTNGLLLLVVDAGAGQIVRFGRDGVPLEGLPLGGGAASPQRGIIVQAEDDAREGEPVGVAVDRQGNVYALDAARRTILRWDRSRNRTDLLAPARTPESALETPISLAASDELLFVLDRGRDAILVYDLYGTLVRRIGAGAMRHAERLAVAGDQLVVVLPEGVRLYSLGGRFEGEIPLMLPESLRDVAFAGDVIYALTPTRIYRAAWAFGEGR